MESMLLLNVPVHTKAENIYVRLMRWTQRKLSVENPTQKRDTIK